MILVTGGAGFIGGNFVLDWLADSDEPVVNLDKLTYAGNLQTLASLKDNPKHIFVRRHTSVDIVSGQGGPWAKFRSAMFQSPGDSRAPAIRAQAGARHPPLRGVQVRGTRRQRRRH